MHTPRQTDVSSSSSAPGQPEGCWNHSQGAHLMKKAQMQTGVKKLYENIFADYNAERDARGNVVTKKPNCAKNQL